MSTISASTTSTTAYKVTADTTGTLVLQTGATPTTAVTVSSAQVVTLSQALPEASGGTGTSTGYYGFKNRIINGAMVFDQRNAGASVTPTADNTYTLDRWKTRNGGGAGRFSVIQSSTSAANFPTSVLLTVTTTSAPSGVEIYGFEQDIEGYNITDFGWGTANAQAVTLSFQVRSSLTGTYCISIRNSAADRSYVAEFTINSANTFETKTITVPAITTGTWLSTNGAGLLFLVCLGSGSTREGTAGSWQSSNIVATSNQVDWINTSSATFYITGVQLEKGSTATSFDYRPYGTELTLCQRYYYRDTPPGTGLTVGGNGTCISATQANVNCEFPVPMRDRPTALEQSGTATDYSVGDIGAIACSAVPAFANASVYRSIVTITVASGLTLGFAMRFRAANGTAGYLGWSAEL